VASDEISAEPISRSSSIVRNRKNGDMTLQSNEDDVIGEIVYWKPSYVGVSNSGNECTGQRELFEVKECLPNLPTKPISHLITSFTIPIGSLAKLPLCSRS